MKRNVILAAVVMAVAGAVVVGAPPQGKVSSVITDPVAREVVGSVPVRDNSVSVEKVGAALLALNAVQVGQIVDAIEVPGKESKDGEDRARYALHGLATVIGKENTASRKALADACAKRLGDDKTAASVKVFLIEQLELAGAVEAVPAIAASVMDKDVANAAVKALVTIDGEEARAALRDLVGKAPHAQEALALGLGELKDAKATEALRPLAESKDDAVRLAADWALANLGDATVSALLMKQLVVDGKPVGENERRQLTADLFLLARRLTEQKKGDAAAEIYAEFWKKNETNERHERIAAFQGLLAVKGEEGMPILLEAMNEADWQIRAAAVKAGAEVPGEKVTKFWVDQLGKGKNAVDVLNVLAARKDPSAFDAVAGLMSSGDEKVQMAAIRAVAAVGGEKAIGALMPVVTSGKPAAKQAAIVALSANPNKDGDKVLAGLMKDDESSVQILGILAARGATGEQDVMMKFLKHDNERVRVAAMGALEVVSDGSAGPALIGVMGTGSDTEKAAAEKAAVTVLRRIPDEGKRAEPVMAAMKTAKAEDKPALLRVLGSVGGKGATEVMVGLANDPDAAVQDVAVRALAKSSDPAVMPVLLEKAKSGATPAHKMLAMQGYLRLLEGEKGTAEEKLKLYVGAMGVASRVEEQRIILAGIGKIESPAALEAAAGALETDGLREEAAAAVVGIAQKIGNGGDVEKTRGALEKVIKVVKDNRIRDRARDALNRLPKKKG